MKAACVQHSGAQCGDSHLGHREEVNIGGLGYIGDTGIDLINVFINYL